ncbi:glycoside hydrolase family protein [Salix suchowensis]|nr:glycoside hydrolase family protein [Salix suchowensis]
MGERSIRKSLQEQLGVLKSDALVLSNGVPKYPTVIGEIGIPYDMDDKRSYGWTDGGKYAGDYSRQERALDASMNACDGVNALNYTIWTYCPDGPTIGGRLEYGGFEFMAKLLAGKKAGSPTQVRKTTTAASSSLSLDTLGQVPSALPIDAQESMSIHKLRERTPRELAGWNENPYNFLTDGARAVRSFARPWPTKVVGIPTDIQFNIAKADFKMTLRVGAEDRVRVGPNGHEGDEELGTEIYVPLVHYASKHVLKGSAAAPLSRGGKDYDLESIVSESGLSTQLSHSTSPTATVKDVPTSDIGSSSSTISPLHDSREMLLLQSDNLIDVEVKVSSGRFVIHGQTLTWWYDVPE